MMPLILVFFLGVANFAAHRAMLGSNHQMLAQLPWLFQAMGGRLSLVVEFAMLLGALIMAASGSAGWALLYALYTALNALSAWLIFSGRI